MKSLKQLYGAHQGKVSDKWEIYLREYDRIFSEFRDKPIRMLEIGIQNGGSLEVWSKFFPNFERLVGCDINPACTQLRYENPRIRVVVGDANTDRSESEILGHSETFDFIIDDGSHTSSDIVRSFARYFPHLKHDGVFVAEDLHCSYWKGFEGGLHFPYASMTFFKRLADVINHQHWGVPTERRKLLAGISEHYAVEFTEELLAEIHSVEFVNSMCVIRKCPSARNLLGKRVMSGVAEVATDQRHLHDTDAPIPDESSNEWATLSAPLEESHQKLVGEIAKLEKETAAANAELQLIKGSTSWRIASALRKIASKIPTPVRKQLRRAAKVGYWVATPHRTPARIQVLRTRIAAKGGVFAKPTAKIKSATARLARVTARAARKIDAALPPKVSRTLRRAARGIQRRGNRLASEIRAILPSRWFKDGHSTFGYHFSAPLSFELSDAASRHSTINVILPSLNLKHLSGGPNTALLIAAMLAEKGEQIRIICCDAPWDDLPHEVYAHMDGLLRRPIRRDHIEFVDGFQRSRKVKIGAHDLFFATAWWTAQIAQQGIKLTCYKKMIYLIQDFEPILHEGSTNQALALETYGFEHVPLVNTRLLLDHLAKEKAGQFASQAFVEQSLCFEPALDREHFFRDNRPVPGVTKKTLLFYARPTAARRNLYELGIAALQRAVACGAIKSDEWDIWGMGESISAVSLGNGVYLKPLPWMNFEGYARRVRTADLLLSLMLSPHPSYPPLEMAASGKTVVTNSFSVKTADRLRDLSTNIIVAEPTAEDIGEALTNAVVRINLGLPSNDPLGRISLPGSWDESLSKIVGQLIDRIETIRVTPPNAAHPVSAGYPHAAESAYEEFRKNRLLQRRQEREQPQIPGLISLVTSAYNTAPEYLAALGRSVLMQDGGMKFEWLILDNGSTDPGTKHELANLSRYPGVRLIREDANLGIIGGMRYLLERAQGRYIVPLDSDDLLEPDFAATVTRYIIDNDFPELIYGDEDKLEGDRFHLPFFKPEWDAVLFLHSCYIAHPCVINRDLAILLECYTDKTAEGCHDWDTFIRFMNAGYVPKHIPEILYSWRIHRSSTSINIAAKSYISDSHRATLQKAVAHRAISDIELALSPLFHFGADWWIRCKRELVPQYHSIAVTPAMTLSELLQKVKHVSSDALHLIWDGVVPDDDEWKRDAYALMTFFPDTVMVGGALHDGANVVGGPTVFGFGGGFDCPDRGRPLGDPGYSAWMFKPRSVSSVSTAHCVISREFLSKCLSRLVDCDVAPCALGPWLGGLAMEEKRRVVYSPFMRARAEHVPEDRVEGGAREAFLFRFQANVPDYRFYSPHLGLTSVTAYSPVTEQVVRKHRQQLHLGEMPHAMRLSRRIKERASEYPIPVTPPSFSVISTIYEQFNFELLQELADTVSAQTLPPSEWLIVVDGPIPADVLSKLRSKAIQDWKARLIVLPTQVGIMGKMQVGLEAATGEYIVPLDCDDLLTPDALAILANTIDQAGKPDMVYSDEDILQDGEPRNPYLRGAFDPVLNTDSSYVWHLCAISRHKAIELSIYSDSAATWCHDWNSITKIAGAGGRIEHVPEILYHWRQHQGSTTNNEAGDSRSLDSVRFVLERRISEAAEPANFFVADWPDNRGARELYIARRDNDLPPLIHASELGDGDFCVPDDSIVVVADRSVSFFADRRAYLEVCRLFELHQDVGAVGGLVIDNAGIVVDACCLTDDTGRLISPWQGRDYRHSGPFALAQKPQTVTTTGKMLAFFRTSALRQAGLWPIDFDGTNGFVASKLCMSLASSNWRVAFSPLVVARSGAMGRIDGGTRVLSGPFRRRHALARYGS